MEAESLSLYSQESASGDYPDVILIQSRSPNPMQHLMYR